jgi:hypothetical protein
MAHQTSQHSVSSGTFSATNSQSMPQAIALSSHVRLPDAAHRGNKHPTPPKDQPRSSTGAASNVVVRESSATRSWISASVSDGIRSVPNASTLNDASTVP